MHLYVTIQVLRMWCCNYLHVKTFTCFYWLKTFHVLILLFVQRFSFYLVIMWQSGYFPTWSSPAQQRPAMPALPEVPKPEVSAVQTQSNSEKSKTPPQIPQLLSAAAWHRPSLHFRIYCLILQVLEVLDEWWWKTWTWTLSWAPLTFKCATFFKSQWWRHRDPPLMQHHESCLASAMVKVIRCCSCLWILLISSWRADVSLDLC